MAFSNAINLEENSICLHEGKFRDLETSGEKVLDYLTLENRLAYEYPEKREEIIYSKRSGLVDIARDRGVAFFGDIAYNNVAFISTLANGYPYAKFVVFFRNCMSFVSSAAAESGIDETPVGWPPSDKELTQLERYIALGRWQPRAGSPEAEEWETWSHRAKNIWLWAETNKALLAELDKVRADRVKRVEFEEFAVAPIDTYAEVRCFLGFEGEVPGPISELLGKRINHRKRVYQSWTAKPLSTDERGVFERFATPMMKELGYDE